jgi:hypothetical protein
MCFLNSKAKIQNGEALNAVNSKKGLQSGLETEACVNGCADTGHEPKRPTGV